MGACMLWVGWFGFNAGSALNATGLASSAFVATHFGAAAAAAGWMIAEWLHNGKPSMLGGISGCVAGLVAITPAAGFVAPMPALIIGFLAGLFCFFMVSIVKMKLGYDDSLDAFGVHGAGGTLGALLTGVFASSLINPVFKDAAGRTLASGVMEGNLGQIGNQAMGVLIALSLGAAGSFVCLKIAAALCGLRPRPDQEEDGLDLSMHGEEGYNLES